MWAPFANIDLKINPKKKLEENSYIQNVKPFSMKFLEGFSKFNFLNKHSIYKLKIKDEKWENNTLT